MATPEQKRAYVSQTGKAPSGSKFEQWLEKKLGGDHSDSGYMKAFPKYGDQTLRPLKKGERSIPEREYMKEFGEDPRDDDYPSGKLSDIMKMSKKVGPTAEKFMKSKPKSVEIGVGDKAKAAAIARVKANMAGEAARKRRREADIESY